MDVELEALDLLTVGEVAARMRVSHVTVRRLITSGALEAVRIGRLVRVAPKRPLITTRACWVPHAGPSEMPRNPVRGMSDEELRSLPTAVDLPTAARALGIGRTKAYELARAGTFPCPVLPLGSRFRVTKHHLFQALGVPPDDPKSAGGGVEPAKPSAAAPSPAVMAVPGGGIPVVLVLQAVLLPGNWEKFAGIQGQLASSLVRPAGYRGPASGNDQASHRGPLRGSRPAPCPAQPWQPGGRARARVPSGHTTATPADVTVTLTGRTGSARAGSGGAPRSAVPAEACPAAW